MSDQAVEEFLEHVGVKGMKWGVRKRAPLKTSSDYKKSSELRKKKHPELTNKQIKLANERANLEQNFMRLNPSKIAKGKAQVTAVLATAALGVSAYNLYNSPAGKALMNLGKKSVVVDENMVRILSGAY